MFENNLLIDTYTATLESKSDLMERDREPVRDSSEPVGSSQTKAQTKLVLGKDAIKRDNVIKQSILVRAWQERKMETQKGQKPFHHF